MADCVIRSAQLATVPWAVALSSHELAIEPALPAGHAEGRWEAADGQSHHSHDIPSLLVVHGQQTAPQLVSGSHDARLYAVPVTRFLKVVLLP